MEGNPGNRLREIVNQVLQSPQLREAVSSICSASSSISSSNSTPPSVHSLPSTSVNQEIRRLFPTVRGRCNNKSNKSTLERPRSFHKDVYLLDSPDEIRCYRGICKSQAHERGFAFSDVKFDSNWNSEHIKTHINELFMSKLHGIDFNIVVPVGGRVVKPNIATGETLNGDSLKRLFHQKDVYLKPKETLTASIIEDAVEEEIADAPPEHNSISHYNDEYERDLERAIINSRNDICEIQNSYDRKFSSVQEILVHLQSQISSDQISQFNVYRADIFNCCLRAINRKNFNPFHKISVMFSDVEGITEGAVDLGGPTREMLRLVIDYIKDSKIFAGCKKKRLFLENSAMQNRLYYNSAKLIVLSLVHGGPAPQFFSDILFASIVGENVTPTIEDVDSEIQEKILKLISMEKLEDVQDYVSSEPIFSLAGCHIINKTEEKAYMVEDILKFYSVYQVKPALEQFIEGLNECHLHSFMVKYPLLFKPIMCFDSAGIVLTSDTIQNLFTISYSLCGSNQRTSENRTISFWRDFILDCEESAGRISLQDILIFATGADCVPPLGFPTKPDILFLHDDSVFPKSNKCSITLSLPTVHAFYKDFKYYMEFGIGNSKDFGFA